MKNFLEATATKPTLTMPIKLTLEPLGSLLCLVKINGKIVYEDTIDNRQEILQEILLTDPINLTIKISRNHPDAIKISLSIDDHLILPLYQHYACPPTCYLDNETLWTFKIQDFYPWYHKITGQGWII